MTDASIAQVLILLAMKFCEELIATWGRPPDGGSLPDSGSTNMCYLPGFTGSCAFNVSGRITSSVAGVECGEPSSMNSAIAVEPKI
jgi:hypothetical protein